MSVVKVVANDTNPSLRFQLIDEETGLPYDLTSSAKSVKAKFREKGDDDTTLWEATCTKVTGLEALGYVDMAWPSGGLAVDEGRYELEVSVHEGTGVQTCFRRVQVRVRGDFADVT